MKPKVEEKLFELGCVLVPVGILVFGYLALSSRWTYSIGIAGLIAGWLLLCWIRGKRNHRRHIDALRTAFARSELPIPQFEDGIQYGFPNFILTFRSEAELEQAKELGCIAAFKHSIQELYEGTGRRSNPFDANRAVTATYVGRFSFTDSDEAKTL